MEILKDNSSIKELEKMQTQVNNDKTMLKE